MSDSRTVFVTGGAGFIGLHVVNQLLERDWKVRIFDNMWRGDRDRANELAKTGNVEVIDQDVRSGAAVTAAMKGARHVIHLAADSINKSVADPYSSVEMNIAGHRTTSSPLRRSRVCERLVYASSASVYGDPQKLPMHEDDLLSPLTPYCISKRTGEDLLGYYERAKGPVAGSRCGSSTSTAPARRRPLTTPASSTTSSTDC